MQRIVLKDGAPPLDQLTPILKVMAAVPLDPDKDYNHFDATDPDGSPMIGRNVENILDAINEERLLILETINDPLIAFGYAQGDYAEETDDPSIEAGHRALGSLVWYWALVDSDGNSWTKIVDLPNPPSTGAGGDIGDN